MEEINNFFADKDLTISTRVHASIISLNNGCLAICENGDSRAKEMCELFKIPHTSNYPNKNIYEIIREIDLKNIENNYISLQKDHEDFLNKLF
jgi:polysaccharide pyruvyl transferase WcaK-like protein